MDTLIEKCEYLHGEVRVPGSKSYTHRVIAAAALDGFTIIKDPSNSHANKAMINVCRKLGADIQWKGKDLEVKGFQGNPILKVDIDVGNSGTALRLAIALASLARGHITLDGDKSLQERPTKPLLNALRLMGANITATVKKNLHGIENEYAPMQIDAYELKGGKISIDGTDSSQYLSSLLLVSPFAKSNVEIEVTGKLVSKPYIDMTIEVMRKFGVNVDVIDDRHYHIKAGQKYVSPQVYEIPGDYSQAAFFLAAACLVKSDITIKGLYKNDEYQADKQIVTILEQMGAKIEQNGDNLRVRGPFELKGVDVDLIKSPDLFPVLSVLGVYAKGEMRLYNMPQIRSKETDRIAVIEREFKKYGIKVESKSDEMTVYQTDLPEQEYEFSADGGKGVTDHRVAMALSLIGIRSGCAKIKEAQSVDISYPDYFEHLSQLHVETKVIESNPADKIVA